MAASAVLCSFALLSGCSDDDVCKVYIPEAKTLQIKNFDLGEELREVFHVAVTASDYVTRSGKEVGGDVKVQLTVDEAKVQEYNSLWNRLSFASFRLLYADNRNCDSGRGEFFCRSGAYGKCTGKNPAV